MSDQELDDYLILREMDEPIPPEAMEEAGEQSGQALEELHEEGVGIKWIKSEVMMDENDNITGTMCHYQAEDEDAIREHADRAGLPVSRIDRRGEPVEGE